MVMTHTLESEQARAHLVAALREQSALCSEPVAQAFLAVPRELFVTCFYEQEGFSWVKRTLDGFTSANWIAALYQDKPLVTLVDARNWPISSSSMPTVMAWMLEALDPRPGMRVLEIGTGCGYNAALLAHIVGDPTLVTSIEIEEDLARAAEQVLHAHIGAVAVYVGDGRLGETSRAPYDRVIATASSLGIPRAWYEQLAPGGCLVMDLQGSLHKSSFLILEKAADGSAHGHFDPRFLYFIPLRSGAAVSARPVARLLREPVTGHVTLPDTRATILLSDNAFLWFLQWYAPGITLSRATVTQGSRAGQTFVTLIDAARETILQLYQFDGQWSGQQHGGTGLWETVERAYMEWERLKRPALDAYEVIWERHQERFALVLRHGASNIPIWL